MKRSKILFFDSGVGGLTLLQKAIRRFPREHYVYYTDSANMPYGEKTKEEVLENIRKNVEEIVDYDLKALIISCYTINALALEELKGEFKIPVISTGAAIKPRNKDFDPRKILVLGTPLMIQHVTPSDLIQGLQEKDVIDMHPLQKLVDFAEEFDFDSPELRRYLRTSLAEIDWSAYHTLVIACSHMIYFTKHIRDLIPSSVDIIDSQNNSLTELGNLLSQELVFRDYELQCFLSGKEVAKEVLAPYMNYLNASSFFQTGNLNKIS